MAKAITFNSESKKFKYAPKSTKVWATKLSSEFLGTIFLIWMIGLLGVSFNGTHFANTLSGGNKAFSRLAIGFWLWLDLFLCLAIFARWSCDLNPLVTAYRMITKEDSLKYGFIKITIQMVASLVAGAVILSTQQIAHAVSHNAADVLKGSHGNWASFVDTGKPLFGYIARGSVGHHAIAFIGEAMGAIILLWSVFNKQIKNAAVKDMIIALAIGVGVAAMLDFDTVAWNPARLLATQYIFDIFHDGVHAMTMFGTYLAGEFAGLFIFIGAQVFMKKYGIAMWEKWMSLGQVKEIPVPVKKSKTTKK